MLAILEQHISPLHARAMLARAAGGDRAIDVGRLPDLVEALERGVRLFGGARLEDTIKRQILALAPSEATEVRIEIAEERDVIEARLAARQLCQTMGSRALVMQRVATAVSELARNVSLYAVPSGGPSGGRRGVVTLTPLRGGAALRIVVEDEGPGIADLKSVLDGSYVSKTGMGKGLVGVKRLVDDFDVRTSPRGTRVEATVVLDPTSAGSAR
ncbi:Putative SigmaB asociated two-component system sensor protein [Sandaracinus amylolyticus]|uniref:Putative SigmaB asociated two-component system sensor protein n=1 Tax=Sandaracinus amylolyticus TaxID=927083 RepID=A0A0F6VYI6_9BACT|nr:Putative SigmaB asociated two-component system sensor protein [Sandaracinus amylolyticus]